ncbi:MAG: hypothetical protein Q7Q73_06430 [Verrucomicrobiota bacterium JB024]|nr:hypothetical protein [Verrucomicrobiota bacterium JB024]
MSEQAPEPTFSLAAQAQAHLNCEREYLKRAEEHYDEAYAAWYCQLSNQFVTKPTEASK